MSIMLCLFTLTYEDQANKLIESLKKTQTETETEKITLAESNSNKPFAFVPKGWLNIQGPSNFCIQDNKKGQGLFQGPCGNQKEALWKFESIAGKYIIIAKSERVINDKLGLKTNGNPIISMFRHNGYNQKWLVDFLKIPGKEGALKLRNFHSDKCMDNLSSSKKDSFYVQMECKEGNENQIFYLKSPVDKVSELTKLTDKQKIALNHFQIPSGWISLRGDAGLCLTETGKGKPLKQMECNKKMEFFGNL